MNKTIKLSKQQKFDLINLLDALNKVKKYVESQNFTDQDIIDLIRGYEFGFKPEDFTMKDYNERLK